MAQEHLVQRSALGLAASPAARRLGFPARHARPRTVEIEGGSRSGFDGSRARVGPAPNPGRLEERSDRESDVIGKFGPGQEERRHRSSLLPSSQAALAALLVPTPTSEIIARVHKLLMLHDSIEEGPGGLYVTCEKIAGAQADELCERLAAAPVVSLAAYRDGSKTFEAIERLLVAAGRK